MDPSPPPVPFIIRPALEYERKPGLELVWQAHAAADRAERIAQILARPSDNGSIPGLWVAVAGDRIVAALFGQATAGRNATLYPAQVIGSAWGPHVIPPLHAALETELARLGTRSVQALLPPASPDAQQLLGAGFAQIADMAFMIWFAKNSSMADGKSELGDRGDLQFLLAMHVAPERLEAIVAATYEQSLDCPALGTHRDIDDVLRGYAANGDTGRKEWHLVQLHGKDVGCLLLAEYQQSQYCELVYMGIVRSARGRGLGRRLIAFAQAHVCARRLARLALAVDTSNAPALRLYDEAGFVVWEERSVYVRSIS